MFKKCFEILLKYTYYIIFEYEISSKSNFTHNKFNT